MTTDNIQMDRYSPRILKRIRRVIKGAILQLEKGSPRGVCSLLFPYNTKYEESGSNTDAIDMFEKLYMNDALQYARKYKMVARTGYWMTNCVAPERDPFLVNNFYDCVDSELQSCRILALGFLLAILETEQS